MDQKELIEKITQEVLSRLAGYMSPAPAPVEAKVSAPAGSRVLSPADVASYIDHTLLRADATAAQVDALCDEAVKHRFCAVCVNSCWVERCARRLRGTGVKVCSVVGFPLGAMDPRSKAFETRGAIENGAQEIDMVINIGALKAGDLRTVEEDIRWVVRACRANVVTKVIIEAALLTDAEKVLVCELARKAGAGFVKTSTGFAKAGATAHDVALMRRTVGPSLGVKAAGGIRSFEDARLMIESGANRIGTSSGVAIVTGAAGQAAY